MGAAVYISNLLQESKNTSDSPHFSAYNEEYSKKTTGYKI